jgi:hypothetical protein
MECIGSVWDVRYIFLVWQGYVGSHLSVGSIMAVVYIHCE